jgi:hypothetical protein
LFLLNVALVIFIAIIATYVLCMFLVFLLSPQKVQGKRCVYVCDVSTCQFMLSVLLCIVLSLDDTKLPRLSYHIKDEQTYIVLVVSGC